MVRKSFYFNYLPFFVYKAAVGGRKVSN